MSYSVCLCCQEMVGSYQKYCRLCERKFKQDENFWKGRDAFKILQDRDGVTKILQEDRLPEPPLVPSLRSL